MSDFININLDEVPSEFVNLPTGIYTLEIEEVEIKPTTKDASKNKLVVTHKVIGGEDGENADFEFTGRKVFDHIGLSGTPISLKQLVLASGVEFGPTGFDPSQLVGKIVTAQVQERTYQDAQTNETKTTAGVKKYMIPAG